MRDCGKNKSAHYRSIVTAVLWMLMCCASSLHAEVTNIDAQLKRAESLRSKEFGEFSNIVDTLLSERARMSTAQSDYLQFLIGYRHAYLGENSEAVAAYEHIINSSDSKDLRFRASISAANVLAITRKYEHALEHLDEALTQIDEIDSTYLKHQAFVIASIIYNLFGNYELANNFAELIINDETASRRDKCASLHIKYRIQLKQDLVDANHPEVLAAIEYCNQANEKIYTLFVIYEQAEYLLRAQQPQDAKQIVRLSFNAAVESKHNNLISLFNHILAQAHWQQGERSIASEYAQKALSLAKLGDFNYQIPKSYNLLHEYYADLKDHQLALYYHKKYMQSDKAYLDDVMAKSMALQAIKHRNIENTQRIRLLSQENDLLTLQKNLTRKKAQNMRLLTALIGILALLILLWAYMIKKKQAGLKKQAQMDHLTNIFNRKGMDDYVSQRLIQCEYKRRPVAFAIFDLDLFKNINDDFGHVVGDWVIRQVIHTCLNLNENHYKFGRLGGEEFGILAENASATELRDFCQRCRLAISQINTAETGYSFSVTASFGVTSTEISGYDYEHLMADADAAMYQAKHCGRDQVALYSNKLQVVR